MTRERPRSKQSGLRRRVGAHEISAGKSKRSKHSDTVRGLSGIREMASDDAVPEEAIVCKPNGRVGAHYTIFEHRYRPPEKPVIGWSQNGEFWHAECTVETLPASFRGRSWSGE